MNEKNFVGELNLEYVDDPLGAFVSLEIDEVGTTNLTMDQVESLQTILERWMGKYREAEKQEDIARRRRQGALDGWEIRRAKQRRVSEKDQNDTGNP